MDWKKEIEKLEGWTFGDNPAMTDDLALKTARGENLANCFLWSSESSVMPRVGDRSYIKNSKGEPVCIVEVREVQRVRFIDVEQSFAELEGYKSLQEWREVHREFFGGRDREFGDHSVIVCQVFKLVHVF